VSIIGEKEKGGVCSKATKSAPTERASVPCKGKSVGRRKKVEEDRGKRSSVRGQATKSAAKKRKGIKEKSSVHPMIESAGTLL